MLYSLETKGALLYLPIRQVMCALILFRELRDKSRSRLYLAQTRSAIHTLRQAAIFSSFGHVRFMQDNIHFQVFPIQHRETYEVGVASQKVLFCCASFEQSQSDMNLFELFDWLKFAPLQKGLYIF